MITISVQGVKALGWTFIAVDVLLTIGRLIIRWQASKIRNVSPGIKRFHVEDALHVFALCCAVVYLVLQWYGLRIFLEIGNDSGAITSPNNVAVLAEFYRIRFVGDIFFWLCIYGVKFAFLFLYRSLFWVSIPFRTAWWGVMAFTIVAFLMTELASLWSCGYPIHPEQIACTRTNLFAIQEHIEYMWCGLNAASSLSILVLPLAMIWNLKLRLPQKLSLVLLFLLGACDMFFDIFRTFYDVTDKTLVWETLEVTIAVMLSALIAYRPVFTFHGRMSMRVPSSRERYDAYGRSNYTVERKSVASKLGDAYDPYHELGDLKCPDVEEGTPENNSVNEGNIGIAVTAPQLPQIIV